MNVYQTNIDGVFVGITKADPDPLDESNMLIPGGCVETAPPSITEGQLARWDGSVWIVEDIPTSEPEPEPVVDPAAEARAQRNMLLASSDWTQLPDSAVADKTVWATYRSLLRDIPTQSGFPNTIIWPTKPA